jgi:hypothetical protein
MAKLFVSDQTNFEGGKSTMRWFNFLFLLMSLASVLAMPDVPTQGGRAVATYNEEDDTDMYMIRGMADPKTITKCTRSVLVGSITYVNTFDEDSGPEIRNFALRTRDGKLHDIYLPEALYPKRLSKEDAKLLPTLIAKGVKARVVIYGCGPSPITLYADQITAI